MLPAVWVNGKREPADALHVSARDRGLTLADGLFETMRAHRGVIFRMDRHLARLQAALAALDIPRPGELREWLLAALPDARAGDAAIRLTVTRGIGPLGVPPSADMQPTVIISVNPFPAFPAAIYELGLVVHVASGRRNEQAMTAGLKTVGYTDAIAAFLEARRAGADEALLLDTAGHCSEATSSNLFVHAGGMLLTPPPSCAVLPGITRATILEIAQAIGVPAAERPFGLEVLLGADEAFLTSSLRGIAPVAQVDGRAIGSGAPGELTRRISDAYARLVAQECTPR
jgi:branched-chain amino acid aminotransferase